MKKRRSFWLVSYPGQEPRINLVDMAIEKAREELKQDGGIPPFRTTIEKRGNGWCGCVQEV
jgi:hypothetical protein